jgi:hypothetical protein
MLRHLRLQEQAHQAVQTVWFPWNSIRQEATLPVVLSHLAVLSPLVGIHRLKKVLPAEVVTQVDLIWGTADLVTQVDRMVRSMGPVGTPAVSLGSLDPIRQAKWAVVVRLHLEEIHLHQNQKNSLRKSELPSLLKPEI